MGIGDRPINEMALPSNGFSSAEDDIAWGPALVTDPGFGHVNSTRKESSRVLNEIVRVIEAVTSQVRSVVELRPLFVWAFFINSSTVDFLACVLLAGAPPELIGLCCTTQPMRRVRALGWIPGGPARRVDNMREALCYCTVLCLRPSETAGSSSQDPEGLGSRRSKRRGQLPRHRLSGRPVKKNLTSRDRQVARRIGTNRALFSVLLLHFDKHFCTFMPQLWP
ncbi:hypothetical protein BJV74DRAFT_990959 [Russula compacta]|nr:hypothetical protein BJV74DRAFT_990959 [Russula compacta]